MRPARWARAAYFAAGSRGAAPPTAPPPAAAAPPALAIRLQPRELRHLPFRRPPRHLVHVRLRLRHAARHRLDDGLQRVAHYALRRRGLLQQGCAPRMGLRKLNTADRRQRHGGRARNFSLAFRRQNRFEVAQDLVIAHASAAWAAQMGRRVATSDQEGDRRPEEDLAEVVIVLGRRFQPSKNRPKQRVRSQYLHPTRLGAL